MRIAWMSLLAAACGGKVAAVAFEAPEPAPVGLDAPGPIAHDVVVSANWAVNRAGVIDLDHPAAAELEKGKHDIVLPIHVLTHPTAGTFVVDTGMPRGKNPARGLVANFVKGIETVKTLGEVLDGLSTPLAGVLLTHHHVDHVLGLVDVPLEVPVYAGLGEEVAENFTGRIVFPTFRRALGDRPLTTLDYDTFGVDVGGLRGIDLLGDGSIYALDAHGHTPGSTAYLARTADGPVLFTGDCSHTQWGWDHNVTPGTYTHDREANAKSLAALRDLAAAHPTMTVYVGHELP